MYELASLLDISHPFELSLLANAVFCIWVIYLGGAEWLENTVLGFMEFGYVGSQKASTIRFLAKVSLAATPIIFLIHLFK